MIAAAGVLGIPLVRSGFRFVLRDYPEVVVTKTGWKNTAGRPGQWGQFTEGNAIHLAIEYAGKGFRDGVEAIAAGLWPDDVPVSRIPDGDRVPFSRKVARIRVEKELTGGMDEKPVNLVPPSASAADCKKIQAWFARKGISPAVTGPLLDGGILYTRPRANVAVFPSYTSEGMPNGFYSINTSRGETHTVNSASSPAAKWVVPGRGSTLHVYQSPLDLLAHMEILLRSGCPDGDLRLALFPDRPKALLHYVLQGGMDEVILHLPTHSDNMLSARELMDMIQGYVKTTAVPIPDGRVSFADVLTSAVRSN